jgi:hypothetical protein
MRTLFNSRPVETMQIPHHRSELQTTAVTSASVHIRYLLLLTQPHELHHEDVLVPLQTLELVGQPAKVTQLMHIKTIQVMRSGS